MQPTRPLFDRSWERRTVRTPVGGVSAIEGEPARSTAPRMAAIVSTTMRVVPACRDVIDFVFMAAFLFALFFGYLRRRLDYGLKVASPFEDTSVIMVRVWFMPSENHETEAVTCRKVLLYFSGVAEGTNGVTLIWTL